MASRNRFLLSFGGTVIALFFCLLFLTASVHRAGVLKIQYTEYGPHGDHISLYIPGFVVQTALGFVPKSALDFDLDPGTEPWIYLAMESISELEKIPDAVFVEVESGNETVLIRKEGINLTIDVENSDEKVHLSIPMNSVKAVLNRINPPGAGI
ncbi:MAG: hypothetical protein KJ970_03215 [Candidatus Eisenbacteria bacterium]|uniref:Uncharacterized protein n=1 Tax=Eiseniibacteriota bacterium TaxID=2212470 RepID=A0A948RTX5_UNCEI|nr:hypothetical protein [Candidatus Eisenbacteria bacterium]MBU1950017.1 hypothetical protein [Candidatus Eisenbacteria bacterium]MBU2689911.1 hypothetical protein [Candidatus Eisenbacteria bacterium]